MSYFKWKYFSLILAIISLLLLVCCGGGGGNEQFYTAAIAAPAPAASCGTSCSAGEPISLGNGVWEARNTSCECVNAAVQQASNGGTVRVPAGQYAWSKYLSLGTKKVTISGDGIGSTVITSNVENAAVINLGSGGSKLSRMTINNGYVQVDGTGFVLSNIRFYNSATGSGVKVFGFTSGVHPSGVIHSCQFVNTDVLIGGAYNTVAAQSALWAQNPTIGGTNGLVFIEGNEFIKTAAGMNNALDGNLAARSVFRYNSVISNCSAGNHAFYIEAHSVQGNHRAYQRWEVYNNTLDNQGNAHYFPFRIRGGTGVVFNNSVTGNWTNDGIALDNVRSYDSRPIVGKCDGTSLWDGNQGNGAEAGYPCRDQIGRGYDAVPWVDNPPGTYTQVLMPAYAWNNKTESSADVPFMVINSSENHIKANRDYYNHTSSFNGTSGVGRGLLSERPLTCSMNTAFFATDVGTLGTLYKCTSTNNWTVYFTPAQCPHPSAGSGTCNPNIMGQTGYTLY
jgi:hypothetical protein